MNLEKLDGRKPPERQVDERYLRAEFAAADSDKNGVLDVDELHTLLAKMGYVTDAAPSARGGDSILCWCIPFSDTKDICGV